MNPNVRRVQELRRSNAAAPHRVKRYAGPDPAEWNEEPVDINTMPAVQIISLDADGNEVVQQDGNVIPVAHVQNICVLLATTADLMVQLATVTKGENDMLAGMVAGLGMIVEDVHNRLVNLQNIVDPT